jgi:cytochrome c
MASLEMNKIAGAILTAGLIAMLSGFVAEELVRPQQATTEGPAGAAAPAPTAPPAIEPVSPLLAKADASAGQQTAKQCQTCHDFTKGGPNKVGPNLWGIVGSHPADVASYSFSDAMKARKDKTWTFEELNKFLAGPRNFIPGTKMTFAGLPKLQDRANVIAWLRQQSDQPLPLPSDADIAAAQKAYEQAKTAAAKPAAATQAAASAAPTQTQGSQAQGSQAQGSQTGNAGGAAAPIAERLKTADATKGEQISKRCGACHDFTKGGPNKIGPNLWGIVGSHPAEVANYSFSDAMKARESKTWTFEELDNFLAGPRNYVPGTKMTFIGLPKPDERADLIAWLAKQSDNPVPLPK